MVGLPKAIIKKYGVTKKAWAVFRGRRKSLHSYVKKAKRKARRAETRMRRRSFRGHRKSGSLMKTVEKLTKATVVALPTIRALMAPADKPAHWVLYNTGYNYHEGRMHWDELAASATPIVATFVGWKVLHKINKLIGGL